MLLDEADNWEDKWFIWDQHKFLFQFKVLTSTLFLQHPFVTQLLTRNLVIELLDMANNPELHNSHTYSMDDNELEVGTARKGQKLTRRPTDDVYRYIHNEK